jgi:hypothetical protein
MAAWPWLLGIDHIIGVLCIFYLFFMYRRLSLVFPVLLTFLLVITNVLVFLGLRNWFVLALPIIGIFAISLIGRLFVKH